MRTVRQLLADKPAAIYTVAVDDSTRVAIERMAEHHVGALPVMEGARLVGIISERDYARKIVLMGRNSLETRVRTIMSVPVVSVGQHQTVRDCMQIMTDRRFRHLPVVEDGKLIGVISIGDCVKAVIDEQQHEIEDLKRYIAG